VFKEVKMIDKSLIKGKDLGLFNQVIQYLDTHNLKYEIRGSVVDNASKGNPRTYSDIDILVNYSNEKTNLLEAKTELGGFAYNVKDVVSKVEPDFRKNIQYYGSRTYMSTDVSDEFIITDPETNTKIDLCFQGNEKFVRVTEQYAKDSKNEINYSNIDKIMQLVARIFLDETKSFQNPKTFQNPNKEFNIVHSEAYEQKLKDRLSLGITEKQAALLKRSLIPDDSVKITYDETKKSLIYKN
jgi:predicted nucleotidyltransferase